MTRQVIQKNKNGTHFPRSFFLSTFSSFLVPKGIDAFLFFPPHIYLFFFKRTPGAFFLEQLCGVVVGGKRVFIVIQSIAHSNHRKIKFHMHLGLWLMNHDRRLCYLRIMREASLQCNLRRAKGNCQLAIRLLIRTNND